MGFAISGIAVFTSPSAFADEQLPPPPTPQAEPAEFHFPWEEPGFRWPWEPPVEEAQPADFVAPEGDAPIVQPVGFEQPVEALPAPEVVELPPPDDAPPRSELEISEVVNEAPAPPLPAPKRADYSLDWSAVAACESGNNWSINTGNGYHGGLQFSPSTWSAYGGGKYAATANNATREQQIEIAENVLRGQGRGAWPICGQRG